ncbi:antirepressor [Staphylococcus aureus]|nr:antirepressor [Staphylococcus aureus]
MQALQTKSNIGEMFNIQEKENGEIAISGRELHQALEVKTPYKKWFERMSDYGFEENIDYVVTDIFVHNPLGGRQNQTDHALTLDTAKEIAMIQRSEPGKRARQYFIQVEKAWNSPEMIMQRALKIANNTINQLETKIERDKPKIVFADAVATTKTSILVGELAKIIKQNGVNIGQRRLFDGYVKTDSLLNGRVWIITCLHSIQWNVSYSKLKKHQSHIRTVTHQLVRRQK